MPSLVIADGVVSAETKMAVEFFVRREDAERFLEDVRADEPELADPGAKKGVPATPFSACLLSDAYSQFTFGFACANIPFGLGSQSHTCSS